LVAVLTVTVGVDGVGVKAGADVDASVGWDVKVGAAASVAGFCAGRLQANIASIMAVIAKVIFLFLFMTQPPFDNILPCCVRIANPQNVP